jgi:hypothetical protein
VAGDGGGHHADGTGPGNQHILSQKIKLLGRVNRIAEGIEDGTDLIGHVIRQFDDVEGGGDDIFGKGPLTVDTDTARVWIEVEMPGPRRFGVQVDDVTFGRDPLTDLQGAIDLLADGDDLAGNSWPVIMGTGTFFWDQSSQFQMWMSVPQMAALCTLINTSSGPGVGTGASINSSPSAGRVLARAFMVWVMGVSQIGLAGAVLFALEKLGCP